MLPPTLSNAVRVSHAKNVNGCLEVQLRNYALQPRDVRVCKALGKKNAAHCLTKMADGPADSWGDVMAAHVTAAIIKGITYGIELERLRTTFGEEPS